MWQAIRGKNWKEVNRRLAPMFVGVSADGKALDRDGWIEYWKNAPIKDFSTGEFQVQPAGKDMVVTFVLNLQQAAPTSSAPGLRVVSVWQQLKKGWVLISTATVPLPPS